MMEDILSERFWCFVSVVPLIAFSLVMLAGFWVNHRADLHHAKHAKIRVARDHINEPR